MEPTLSGTNFICIVGGFAVGLGIGYFYGWLHFSGDEEGDEE